MTFFQLLMLGASAFFAFKVYEHVQALQDPEDKKYSEDDTNHRSVDSFSTFSPEALVEKADNAYEEKDFVKALAFLNEANAKDANNPDILFKIGYILQQSGDDAEAIKYYKESLEFYPNNEFVHNSLATIYRKRGEYTTAKMHLNQSLDIDDENPITYYNYGNLSVDMQNIEQAKEMYKKAISLDEDFKQAKEELDKLEER